MLSAPAANMVRAKVPQESQESCEQGGGVGRSPKKPAAVSVLGSGVSLQEGLGTNDALGLHIALFLYGWEVCVLGSTSRYWRGLLRESLWLWQRLASRDVHPHILAGLKARRGQQSTSGPNDACSGDSVSLSVESWRGLYETSVCMGRGCERVGWQEEQLPVLNTPNGRQVYMRAMEGHAAALVQHRYAVIVGGFGRGIRNELYVADTLQWGQQSCRLQQWWAVPVVVPEGEEEGYEPPRVYGHTAVALPDSNKLLVYGGVRFGGYQGAVSEAYVVELVPSASLSPPVAPSTPWLARRTRIDAVGVVPSRAAYCSLSVGGGYVWRFGGLSDGHCLNTLHALPLSCLSEPQGQSYSGQWVEPQASGTPPSERMGHSSVWVEGAGAGGGGCLVVAGGSDGTDLLRDGRELHDVHILTVTHSDSNSSSAPTGPLVVSWSVVQQAPPRTALGRTHSAHLTGSGSVLYYGGSARLSQSLAILTLLPPHTNTTTTTTTTDTDTETGSGDTVQWRGQWKEPRRRGRLPTRRISHVSLLVGQYMWVHGGWNGQELDDSVLLDLAPNPRHHTATTHAQGSGGASQYETEHDQDDDMDDEEEEEEEEEEEGMEGAIGGCVQS